jgi:hypothetical protein
LLQEARHQLAAGYAAKSLIEIERAEAQIKNLAWSAFDRIERRTATARWCKGGQHAKRQAEPRRLEIRAAAAEMPGGGRGRGETKQLAVRFSCSPDTISRALRGK